MDKIRVIVVDDQELIREGISIILSAKEDIEVIAVAENGLRAVELARQLAPDLVLLDINMPELSGIDALKRIKEDNPKIVVLMLTTFDQDEYILDSFKNGASGYILKDFSGDKLAAAIRNAVIGNITMPTAIAARLISQIPEGARESLDDYDLTAREREIAMLMLRGYNNEAISKELEISMGTVKNYISTLYSKLEATSRKEAIYILTSLKK